MSATSGATITALERCRRQAKESAIDANRWRRAGLIAVALLKAGAVQGQSPAATAAAAASFTPAQKATAARAASSRTTPNVPSDVTWGYVLELLG